MLQVFYNMRMSQSVEFPTAHLVTIRPTPIPLSSSGSGVPLGLGFLLSYSDVVKDLWTL